MAFVFVINTKEKNYTCFEEILEGKTFTANLHQNKHTEVFPNAINKAREKIYAHGIRCEN
ncbi:hypothetical protein pdam_00016236 [Pocillopora damicornis]|uniref:Uncharacterized protein n=1 Tax=Pocillopora damicornis TaxID=46731 RepID=A0A3M6UGT9_POCDA|nr:hypothetical protein pdam_00016236 [Pocillopora damicornis]